MKKKKFLFYGILGCCLAASSAFIAYAQVSGNLFMTRYQWISFHDPNSSTYIDNCVTCHGERLNEDSLDPSIKKAHSKMTFFGTGSARCKSCHVAPDFISHSAVHIRQQVDKVTCSASACHGRSSSLPFYAVNSDETAVQDWAIFEACPVSGSKGRSE